MSTTVANEQQTFVSSMFRNICLRTVAQALDRNASTLTPKPDHLDTGERARRVSQLRGGSKDCVRQAGWERGSLKIEPHDSEVECADADVGFGLD